MTLPLLTAPKLERAGYRHAFTTRLGGVSQVPYDSLDFAVLRTEGEQGAHLRENQARLAQAIGYAPSALHQAIQVHGSDLVVADGSGTLAESADALVAEPDTDHAVGVRVADCVPVLVADVASGRVAAVHAGWRGIEAGVIQRAILHLAGATGAEGPGHFLAAIGPCIGPCCFEVGPDVAERIVRASNADVVDRHVTEDDAAKVFIDLRRAVRTQLRRLGLEDDAIDDVPGTGRGACTRCDRERFYSYRRDGDASGRLLAVIVAGSSSRGASPHTPPHGRA